MKKTHQSTNSHGSTYPLPSLCSSISSYNSSSKSLPLITKNPTTDADIISQPNINKRQRWDDSQFAIELCDDSYKSVGSSKSTSCKSSNGSHHTTKTLTKKISKLFNHHTHHSDSSNSSHQISVNKFTSLLRKIKSMKSL